MSSDDSAILEGALDKLFTDTCTTQSRQLAEDEGWLPECWDALAETGLAWVGTPESTGGAGGSFEEACLVVSAAGRHAVPLPLADGILLGGWALAQAGLRLPDGPVTYPTPRHANRLVLEGGRLDGVLERVPWARRSAGIVALADTSDGPRVVLLDSADATVTEGRNLAGEPRETLVFSEVALDPARIGAPTPDLRRELALRGALSRTLLMAAAMGTISAMTIRYSRDRKQFGKPIGSFQAVGNRIVRVASEAELSISAAAAAAALYGETGVAAAFEVAAAKASVSRSASEVATQTHQIHGAIGMTQEYALHQFTRRLWSWRQEWGSESHWAVDLGTQVATLGAEGLWPRVATGLVEPA
jgi:acyl-CoA dehydrogenase